jgi:excisionase family DNA binding protein
MTCRAVSRPTASVTLSQMATNTYLPSLLTVREVAAALRLSEPSVYRLIRTGDLPAVRLSGPGSSLRVRIDDLDAFTEPTQPEDGERKEQE